MWTTEALAEKVGLSDRHIRNLIANGTVVAEKVGRDWIITDEEADRFIALRRGLAEDVSSAED